jgi:large subunit ribosomal protein L25
MAELFKIEAQKRKETGKKSTKSLRKEGLLPANIYGNKTQNHSITVNFKDVTKRLMQGNFLTQPCEISFGEEKIQALPRQIAFHPVTDQMLHLDFYQLKADEKVRLKLNIKLLNEAKCAGVKEGGIANISLRKLDVECLPKDIISEVSLDLEKLKIGDSLHVHNLNLPEGVEPYAHDKNQTIVAVIGRKEEEEEEEEEVVEGEAKEGGEGDAKGDDKPAAEKKD